MNCWKALAALAHAPSIETLEARQTAWLLNCLRRNETSDFGHQHGFATIDSISDYQHSVPIHGYEDLREPIKRIAAGASGVLFTGCPIAFERTGGSSGGAKLIPYSEESLADFRCALLGWLGLAITSHGIQDGCAYWALSPATRSAETTSGGTLVGLPDAAYFGAEAGRLFAELSAVPVTLAQENDVMVWQRETLYWLLRRVDLALISVWSPSFFTSLLEALPQHSSALLVRLAHDDVAAAQRLRDWLEDKDSRKLWPNLRLVSCWADASSRPYFNELRQRLPQAVFQPKGLLSTEAVVTIPDAAGRPLLAADSGFYEFLGDDGLAHPAWTLRNGARYEVVVTTAGGLYRYRTSDRVQCAGYVGDLPVLNFVGRIGQVSDLVGEKLTDEFVADCLAEIPGFRLLLPRSKPAGYVLVHEGRHSMNLLELEERLFRNPQYAYARRMTQLQPLAEQVIPDALSRYMTAAIQRGQCLGDVKLPALCLNTGWPGKLIFE